MFKGHQQGKKSKHDKDFHKVSFNMVLNQSIKTNEFFLRFKFEKSEKEDLPEKTKDEAM